MQVSYTITRTQYGPDAGDPSTEVVDFGMDDLRPLLTRARRTYGIASHDSSERGTPWWRTQGVIEDRAYFEHGTLTEYTLAIGGIGYRNDLRIRRVNALLQAIR
jgi:hypothetical protein